MVVFLIQPPTRMSLEIVRTMCPSQKTAEIQSAHSITPSLAPRIAVVRIVAIVTGVDGEQTVVYIDDVFCILGAEFACCRLDLHVSDDLSLLSTLRR